MELLLNKGYYVDIIISPHNPHKSTDDLLPYDLRVELCELSIQDYFSKEDRKKVLINKIEERLSTPNYTYLTLIELTKEQGDKPTILLGTDVIENLKLWRNFDEIKRYPIIEAVRKRNSDNGEIKHSKEYKDVVKEINLVDKVTGDVSISSTEVREMMMNNQLRQFCDGVYLTENTFIRLEEYYEPLIKKEKDGIF
jgi:nicotinic acid mononucleotide adenylyltransferase